MNKNNKPIKLEDLARKLKVSKVTVSKALRDHPDISPKTTAKVKELAEKVGYMPNYMAKNLSSKKSHTIGLIVPKIAHVFFATVIESVYDTAFEHNYETLLTVSQEQSEREHKHILTLLSMKVDGIIISITQETKELAIFDRIKRLGVPLVFIDRVPNLKDVSTVTVDDIGGAFSATEYAIKKGCKKIAHIGGYSHINIGKRRQKGFLDAMNKYDVPVNKNWIIEGGFGEEDGYQGFKKIYNKKELPDYIFAVTYPVALGIKNAASEYGIKIPEDIEITCFGKDTFNPFVQTNFNFVDQPAEELGREAVELILEKINHPQSSANKNIELQTKLIINDSEKVESEKVA